jgi:hypothetical protein
MRRKMPFLDAALRAETLAVLVFSKAKEPLITVRCNVSLHAEILRRSRSDHVASVLARLSARG